MTERPSDSHGRHGNARRKAQYGCRAGVSMPGAHPTDAHTAASARRRRPVRQPSPVGADPVLRARHPRDAARTVAVVGRPPGHRADRRPERAVDAVVRDALHAAGARRPPVHRPRGALRPRHRRGAVGALPGHPQPAADGRARRSLPRRDRGSLRRRVLRPRAVPAAPRRSAAARPGRAGDRDDARRGALDLREPADFHRGAAAGHRRGSGGPLSGGRTRRGPLHGGADLDQELLPPRRRPAHGVPGEPLRPPARHHRHRRDGPTMPGRGATSTCPARRPTPATPGPRWPAPHVCVVLNPRREIKVFAEGRAGVQLQPRRLAAVRPVVEVRVVAVGRRQRRAGRAAVPLRPRSVGRAPGRAVRRAAPARRVAGPAGGGHRPPRHGAARAGPARRGRRRAATCCTCWPGAP